MKSLVTALTSTVLALVLSGCYESSQVTVYKPGVYKGAKDPLLQTKGEQRQEQLRKRFELVQKDR